MSTNWSAAQICGVAGVQPGPVRVRRGGDEQVEAADPWLTPRRRDRSRKHSVARCDRVIDRKGVEGSRQTGE